MAEAHDRLYGVNSVAQGLSRRLSGVLVGTLSNPGNSGANGDAGSTDAGTAELGGNLASQAEPLRPSSTNRHNRDRFEENQRAAAAQLLMRVLPVFCCLLFSVLAFLVVGVVLYISGWRVWSQHGDKPCDQPLRGWLLVTLLGPLLQCGGNCQSNERLRRLHVLVMPAVILAGAFMWFRCKTCADTNPELYHFTKVYLVYQTAWWLLLIFVFFGLVTLIVWMAQNGLLEAGPGPAMAAKPGLIREFETVEYNPALFSARLDDDKQPAECCICQDLFSSEKTIKRTPCGHYFHEECLGDWLGKFAKSCPLCRTDLEEAVERGEVAPQALGSGEP